MVAVHRLDSARYSLYLANFTLLWSLYVPLHLPSDSVGYDIVICFICAASAAAVSSPIQLIPVPDVTCFQFETKHDMEYSIWIAGGIKHGLWMTMHAVGGWQEIE